MSARKTKPKNLSEKVAQLVAPESGEDSEEEAPPVVEFDEYGLQDARLPDVRKKNIQLLSEQSARYKGKISLRKDFEGDTESNQSQEVDILDAFDDSESNQSEEADELERDALEDSESNQSEEADELEKDSESESLDDEIDYNGKTINSNSEDEASTDEDDEIAAEPTKIVSEKNHQNEVQKGACVQNQLKLWEKLLELRIHSQKLLSKCNQLPLPAEFEVPEIADESMKTTEKSALLLKSLLELQNALGNQFSELKKSMENPLKRSNATPLSNYESGAPPLKRIAEYLDDRFKNFKAYRNAVLLKWDDRTKLLTPGAGAKKKSLTEEFDVIRKIENALQNRSALIEKSQTPNNNSSKTVPTAELDESPPVNDDDVKTESLLNVHIYDDTDFYHQQLRELIEYKANSSANMAEVTKQYVELQKLRQKMKKKVDTRASKGRKTRYIVYNKLVNFMAPDDYTSWTEESKNELCKSLFAT